MVPRVAAAILTGNSDDKTMFTFDDFQSPDNVIGVPLPIQPQVKLLTTDGTRTTYVAVCAYCITCVMAGQASYIFEDLYSIPPSHMLYL